jgi:hypothetical protein
MDNLRRDNQPVKSVWDAARRVEKAPALVQPVTVPAFIVSG